MSCKIAILGCGDIFPNYLQGLRQFSHLELVAIADRDSAVAEARAAQFAVPAQSVEQVLNSQAGIIINLTPAAAHFQVSQQILGAGKHVYSEKPLAASFAEGQSLLQQAQQAGLRIACAPDTFLGAAGQAARELLDSQMLGRVIAGQANLMERGPDDWHPNPAMFYDAGAGPMLDMGVYYLTQLVQLLGPICEVQAAGQASWPERKINRGPAAGQTIHVKTPSHISALCRFEQGALVQLTTSFDVWRHQANHIELFAEAGSLVLPDPNNFGGEISYCLRDGEWQSLPNARPYRDNLRGLGVAEFAAALQQGRPHRTSAELALHVLEAMEAIILCCGDAQQRRLQTRCQRPQITDFIKEELLWRR